MRKRRVVQAILVLAAVAAAVPGAEGQRRRPGSLAGVVLGADQRGVPGARVIVQESDGTRPRSVETDARGRFRLSVRQGLYDLRAQSEGLSSAWERNVLVRAGRSTEVQLRLAAADTSATTAPAALALRGGVREWTVPVAESGPHDPAADPSGNVWLTLIRSNQLARLDPRTGEWKIFTAPTENSGPHGLVSDRQGNIWYTANYAGKIGRLDARTGEITEYAVPTAGDPHTPVFAPDGRLWFTAPRANMVVRMDTASGKMDEFPVPTPNARPYGLVTGSDGNLWYCAFGTNKLGRIHPGTGEITEFAIPFQGARPRRLWPLDGAIFYADFARGTLGRLEIERRMGFKEWPSPSGPRSQPYGMAADLDGHLWYSEFNANQLVRFDPEKEEFTRFTLPSPKSEIRHMARGPDGRIWMALSGANKVAVIE